MAADIPNCLHPKSTAREQEQDEGDGGDSPSLSDFPTERPNSARRQVGEAGEAGEEGAEEFEFSTAAAAAEAEKMGDPDLICIADEIFFQGQLLPLERSSSGSLTSSSMSRSHSTDSTESAPRLSGSSHFYAHPSPKPGVPAAKKKTTGAVARGAGLFGVLAAPEMGLGELRQRRRRKRNGSLWQLFGERLSCKCSVGVAVETSRKDTDRCFRSSSSSAASAASAAASAACSRSSRTVRWLEDHHLPSRSAP